MHAPAEPLGSMPHTFPLGPHATGRVKVAKRDEAEQLPSPVVVSTVNRFPRPVITEVGCTLAPVVQAPVLYRETVGAEALSPEVVIVDPLMAMPDPAVFTVPVGTVNVYAPLENVEEVHPVQVKELATCTLF